MKRLKITERSFQDARHFSQIPLITGLFAVWADCLPASLAQLLLKNRFLPAIMSNFPGPEIKLKYNEMEIVTMDFCAGGLIGIAGVVFTVLSCNNHVRFAATAETGVMDRMGLRNLIARVQGEIELLYQMATE